MVCKLAVLNAMPLFLSVELNLSLLAALNMMSVHLNVKQLSLVTPTATQPFSTALSSISMPALAAAFNMMPFHSTMNRLFAAFIRFLLPGSNAIATLLS